MCGRYEIIDGKRIYSRFQVAQPMLPIPDNGDVRPTQHVMALQADRILAAMRWGLVPAWAKDPRIGTKMINARSEGIASKLSFKRPLRFLRCIIPASAFFEWQGRPGAKVKYRILRKDDEFFGFAGIRPHWPIPPPLRVAIRGSDIGDGPAILPQLAEAVRGVCAKSLPGLDVVLTHPLRERP